MSSLSHNNTSNQYEINITDAVNKKRDSTISANQSVAATAAHVSTGQRSHTHQFSNHFNFPYRIQFNKSANVSVVDPYSKQQMNTTNSNKLDLASDDGKYFYYNTKMKNDMNYLRNSENLNDLNQMKRRSAHLFNM